jgi:hypothetical protein
MLRLFDQLTISPRANPPQSVIDNSIIIHYNRHNKRSASAEPQPIILQDVNTAVEDVPPDDQNQRIEPDEQKVIPDAADSPAEAQDTTAMLNPVPTQPIEPSPPPKITSWASLLRGQSSNISSSSKGANSLPVSSVVGISIPAERSTWVPDRNEVAIVKLLTSKSLKSGESHRLVPRGLLNLGNMCFANIILQGLVYTFPFWSLFRELKKLSPNPIKTPKGAPLLNAT